MSLDIRATEIVIVEGLKTYLSTEVRPCEVIRQNQIARVPEYPYVSYTIITPASESVGTYSEARDGTLYRSTLQTWSFTVQSDDMEESLALGMRMYDFFSAAAHAYLADRLITVRKVTDLTTRDNLITMQYEYRQGLDVTFGLLYLVEPSPIFGPGKIEDSNLKGG